jgi:capsular polysaccharide transport system permease protein
MPHPLLASRGGLCFQKGTMSTSDSLPEAEARLPLPRMQSLRVIVALVLREMGSAYGRSPGGYIWAIASPLGSIVIMSLAFSLLVRTPALGTSFMLFYATGYLPFDMFNKMANKIGNSVRYSRALLAYPRVSWLDAIIARSTLTVLTTCTVFCIVIFSIMHVVDTHTLLDIGPIIEGLMIVMACGVGIGMINCLMTGYFPVWDSLWAIFSRPLMVASGIFFLYEDLPPVVQSILWWNPLIHGISLVRSGFYPTYHASFVSHTYALAVPMLIIPMAMLLLRRGYLAAFER